MQSLAQRIASLSPEKRKLFLQQLKQQRAGSLFQFGEHKERPGFLPLSFAQQRLWFLEQLEPGSSAYTIPISVRLVGSLNINAFEKALCEVLRRHESFALPSPQWMESLSR